jgi:DNA (cytosine-5)-methyltransferase 1
VPFTFVDLFAGVGGFHAALSALGGQAVLAAEVNEPAAAVYEANWCINPRHDVVALGEDAARLVPSHTVLTAGFPCQPFSKCGYQRGIDEQRGQLFDEVLKIVRAHRPPVVMLENVRNISGRNHHRFWMSIVEGLRVEGYRVAPQPSIFSPHFLPPERGGTPQARERAYIMATYVGRERAQVEVTHPVAIPRAPVDGWDPNRWSLEHDLLLADSDIPAPGKYRLTNDEIYYIEVWNDLLVRLGDAQIPGYPLWSSYWHDGAHVDADAPPWKRFLQRHNIEFYLKNRRAIRAWLAANPRLCDFPASRQKLEWQAQSSPRNLWTCLLQMRPSGIRAKKPNYSPALVAMSTTQMPIVGPRSRRIVPREAARLQGFPDWVDFGNQSDEQTYKQLGNAVHVGAAYYVLREHVLRYAADVAAAGGEGLVDAVGSAPRAPVVPQHRRLLLARLPRPRPTPDRIKPRILVGEGRA